MKRMEIVLGRHGKPKVNQWAWIAPRHLAQWIRAYNVADILIDEIPPQTLKKAVRCGIIASSPLHRCVQSAQLLGPSQASVKEELLREAGIPYANWGFPRLPLSVWAVVFRVAWFCGYSSNSEPLSRAKIRARHAAERLIELAQQHESVFVVGHGIMTVLIAKELLHMGWSGPKRPANRYWKYCVYRFSA